MWIINGTIYDLRNFLDKHPGGREILEESYGQDDLTAAFESYHSLSDKNKILNIMEKYKVKDIEKTNFIFNKDSFYYILSEKVKNKLNNNTKADIITYIKVIIQLNLYIISFYYAFLSNKYNFFKYINAIFAGHILIQLGFCSMHDASHCAFSKNKYVNKYISLIWNSLALWDSKLWIKHHSIRHHSFTGDNDKDPDIIHFKPFIRKNKNIDKNKYFKIPKKFLKLFYLFTLFIFPGMFTGQGFLYNFIWLRKKYLWKMELSKFYKISFIELFIKSILIFSILYSNNFLLILLYFISQNITYSLFILPDHDTLETHINIINYKNKDWGEVQVRNSGNFCNENKLITYLFGGINYQIEHHLFPSLCHIHYPKIKKIVMETCKEFNIPYVHNDSLYKSFFSTLKNYENINYHK